MTSRGEGWRGEDASGAAGGSRVDGALLEATLTPAHPVPAGVAAVARESAVAATAEVDALIDGRRSVASLLDAEFFAAFEELAARKRMLDATLLEMTAELLGRDEVTPVAFAGSLVRRGGFRSVHEAVQQVLGLRRGEAVTLREIAEATRRLKDALDDTWKDLSA